VKAAVWRENILVRPAGNRTSDLSLMRRVWYHKTTASALVGGVAECGLLVFVVIFKRRKTRKEMSKRQCTGGQTGRRR
jgi:hypothetical protein